MVTAKPIKDHVVRKAAYAERTEVLRFATELPGAADFWISAQQLEGFECRSLNPICRVNVVFSNACVDVVEVFECRGREDVRNHFPRRASARRFNSSFATSNGMPSPASSWRMPSRSFSSSSSRVENENRLGAMALKRAIGVSPLVITMSPSNGSFFTSSSNCFFASSSVTVDMGEHSHGMRTATRRLSQ